MTLQQNTALVASVSTASLFLTMLRYVPRQITNGVSLVGAGVGSLISYDPKTFMTFSTALPLFALVKYGDLVTFRTIRQGAAQAWGIVAEYLPTLPFNSTQISQELVTLSVLLAMSRFAPSGSVVAPLAMLTVGKYMYMEMSAQVEQFIQGTMATVAEHLPQEFVTAAKYAPAVLIALGSLASAARLAKYLKSRKSVKKVPGEIVHAEGSLEHELTENWSTIIAKLNHLDPQDQGAESDDASRLGIASGLGLIRLAINTEKNYLQGIMVTSSAPALGDFAYFFLLSVLANNIGRDLAGISQGCSAGDLSLTNVKEFAKKLQDINSPEQFKSKFLADFKEQNNRYGFVLPDAQIDQLFEHRDFYVAALNHFIPNLRSCLKDLQERNPKLETEIKIINESFKPARASVASTGQWLYNGTAGALSALGTTILRPFK